MAGKSAKQLAEESRRLKRVKQVILDRDLPGRERDNKVAGINRRLRDIANARPDS